MERRGPIHCRPGVCFRRGRVKITHRRVIFAQVNFDVKIILLIFNGLFAAEMVALIMQMDCAVNPDTDDLFVRRL